MKFTAVALLFCFSFFTVWRIQAFFNFAVRGERLFWSAACSVLGIGTLACILAMCGVYHLWLLVAITVFILVGLQVFLCIRRGKRASAFGEIKQAAKESVTVFSCNKTAAALLVVAALLYFLFPSLYLWGGRDYGLYIINGVHIAETGAVQYDTDLFVDQHFEELKDFAALDYPALFSAGKENEDRSFGEYDPQFLPGYSAFLAVGYDMAGIDGLIRVNGILSLLAAACLYLLAKRYFSARVAKLALLFLVLCPAQLWGARITQSEQLAQLLLLIAAVLFADGWARNSLLRTQLGTLAIGLGCFVRMDNYLAGIGLLAVACYAFLWKKSRARIMAWSAFAFAGWMGVSLWYGFVFHHHYYFAHWIKSGALRPLILGCCAALAVTLLLGLLRAFVLREKALANPIQCICQHKYSTALFCAVLAIGAAFCYFVRPLLGEGFLANNFVEYFWYLCPLVLPLSIFGLYAFAFHSRFETYFEPLLYFLASGLISVIGYTLNPAISYDHFWASRRWIPINFPFFILLASAGIIAFAAFLRNKGLRKLSLCSCVLCTVCVGGYMAWQCRAFAFTPMLKGLDTQYERLASVLPDGVPTFTNNGQLASVLKIVYHKPVYLLNPSRELTKEEIEIEKTRRFEPDALMEYLDKYEEIFWIGFPGHLLGQANFEPVMTAKIQGTFVKSTLGVYPTELETSVEEASVFRITSGGINVMEIDLLPYLQLNGNAKKTGDAVRAHDTNGFFLFGPYMSVPAGTYRVTIEVETEDGMTANGYWDAASNGGAVQHLVGTIKGAGIYTNTFILENPVADLEIRLSSSGGDMLCKSVVLEQVKEN